MSSRVTLLLCVLTMLVAVDATAAVRNGKYTGQTSQHKLFWVTVAGHTLTYRFVGRNSCRTKAYPSIGQDQHFKPRSGGRFSWEAPKFKNAPRVLFAIRGRFHGSRVTGQVRYRDAHGCDTGWVTYRAKL
jgi:hypothetical protein